MAIQNQETVIRIRRRTFSAIELTTSLLAGILAAIVIFAFLAPLAAIPLNSVIHSSGTSTAFGSTGYSFQSLLKIILFTFEQSLASTALSLLIGLPAAFFIAKRNFLGRKLLMSTASIPLCIPSLIIALGYVSTFGMSGYMNTLLMKLFSLREPPLTFLYSFWGIVVAQGFYNFPLVMATVANTWNALPSDQADSARLLGASEFRVFRTITVNQLLPAIVSSCIPVFLYCFFSFMIVLLFGATGCTTLEVAVYHSARSTLDFKSASLLACIETTAAFGMLLSYAFIENKSSRNKGISFSNEFNSRSSISKKEFLPSFIFFIIIFIFFIMPLLAIAISSFTSKRTATLTFTLDIWKKLFTTPGFFSSVYTTIRTALIVSVLCTTTAFVYALFVRLVDPLGKNALLRTIPLLPMAVSSVVMGLGMTLLVRRGTSLALVLAESALSWPFAFRQIYAPLVKIPQQVIDAATILSRNKFDAIFHVYIPYSIKGILSALGFCFAISAGDATLPLVLAIPHFDTLALFTYRLAGSHQFSASCASGLVLGILCSVLFSLTTFNHRKQNIKGR
jgi:thiamine transport system permease protein